MDFSLGLSLGGRGGASSSIAASQPIEDYITGSTTQGYWATDVASRIFTSISKAVNVTNGETAAVLEDKAGAGPDLIIANTAQEPEWIEAEGLLESTTPDFMTTDALTTRSADMYFACIIQTTDTNFFVLQGSGTTNIAIRAVSAGGAAISIGVGTPSFRLDGATVSWTTGDDAYTAIADGNIHVLEIIGVDLTASNFGTLTYFPGSNFTGKTGHYVLIDNANLDDAGRADIVSQLMTLAGI